MSPHSRRTWMAHAVVGAAVGASGCGDSSAMRIRLTLGPLLVIAALAAGCGDNRVPLDAGPLDAGPLDGGTLDGGPLDGGTLDAGNPLVDGGAFCATTACDTPPAAACEGATLVTFDAAGTCDETDDRCDYPRSEEPCPLGCGDDGCLDRLSPTAFIKAANADSGDRLGFVVDTDGDRVVVSALGESSASAATPDDNSVSSAGAVYVFLRTATGWVQEAMLKASHPDVMDNFGHAVAIDGDVIAVGSPFDDSATGDPSNNDGDGVGAVFIFRRVGETWIQEAFLQASNAEDEDDFGYEIGLSGDTLVVGAPKEDSATGAPSDNSGHLAGAAYVFERTGGAWTETAYLKASNVDNLDDFGSSVAIDGDRIVVGAFGEWSSGLPDDNSMNGAGAAYVFERGDGSWPETAYLKSDHPAENHWFAHSVAVDADVILIGTHRDDSSSRGVNQPYNTDAINSGAAHIFRFDGTTWALEAYLKSSNSETGDGFGSWVDLSGDTAVIGALSERSLDPADPDNNDGNAAGAAYVFRRGADGTWSEIAYLKAPSPDARDHFGRGVAIDGSLVVVGSRWDDSNSRGVDGGDPANNDAEDSGAVFLFEF